ncbi:hypothetical protein E5329_16255 [Petralouisia muris]|uniref:Uncharacterized protein n=1 Tax=Petralouisia muris TaxID=3032872 RepID=A0AC61RTT6_9FIRM|nr:hypothetical protein [Petralouisia muris]TGY95210.1 hypothetical protein E5329_16255 [Petralouisia muris]
MKKKLTFILTLCIMCFTLTLPVSASQKVSEEKQPRVQLSVMSLMLIAPVSESQTVLGEKQPQAQECEQCGEMTSKMVFLADYEQGPISTECKHGYPYGDDLTWEKYATYQYQCSNPSCLYKSSTWNASSDSRTKCFGHR